MFYGAGQVNLKASTVLTLLLALYVIQKAHNFKSKNGMLINGCLTH